MYLKLQINVYVFRDGEALPFLSPWFVHQVSSIARALNPSSSRHDLLTHDHIICWPLVEFEEKTASIGHMEFLHQKIAITKHSHERVHCDICLLSIPPYTTDNHPIHKDQLPLFVTPGIELKATIDHL
jgi:hypothetical protein